MIKINLVPEEILAKELQRQRGIQAGVAVGALLAGVMLISMGHIYRANRLENLLKEQNRELDKLQKIVAQVEELEATAAAVRARLGVITDLLKGRALYPYFMADFSHTLPSDVWVLSLNTTSKDSNSLGLSISANSRSGSGVAAWMRNLQKSGVFTEPSLGAISASGPENLRVNAFTLSTTYRTTRF